MGRIDGAGEGSAHLCRDIALRAAALKVAAGLLRRHYPVGVGAALSVALALPFGLRQNAWFEWANPYWLLLLQRENILASGGPSYFAHTAETGNFYPIHLFYAGFTVSLLAYVAALVPPSLVFSATIGASFFAAFIGISWLARALGVGGPVATAAAALYVTNPQYVAKIYTRGAWAEFVAVSMLTLMVGSAARAITDRHDTRSTTVPIAFVAIATMFLAGTHNLTFALGLPLAAVLAAAHAWDLHDDLRSAGHALVAPGLAAAVGLAISAVFTIPNLWLSESTAITAWDLLDQTPELNTPSAVLEPHLTGLQSRVNEVPSLLFVAIALFLAATVTTQRRQSGVARIGRLAPAAAMAALLLTVLTTRDSLWSDTNSILHRVAPEKALRTIQFPSRLTSFLALALLVLVLSLDGRAKDARLRRVGRAAVMVAAAWYVSLGLVFAFAADRTSAETSNELSYGVIDTQSVPVSFAAGQQTQFLLTERGVAIARPSRTAVFDPDGQVVPTTPLEPGVMVATNVVWSPLIRFSGADLLGRDEKGMAVIIVRSSPPDAVAVTTRRPPAVVAGAMVSVLGLAATAWWLTTAWARRRSTVATRVARSDAGSPTLG